MSYFGIAPTESVQHITAPIPTIHSIYPNPALPSEMITFYGSGQDQDENGQSIANHRWRTDIITLSTSSRFTLRGDELGIGSHTIYFQVQDDEGVWSDELTCTLLVNIPPTATILSITPNPITHGFNTVTFSGAGFDPDEGGQSIVAYNWRSDLEGQLSTQPTFTLPTWYLEAGTHTIYFKAKDDEGIWSEEVTATLTVNPLDTLTPPYAFINDIHPPTATQGQDVIFFDGFGIDLDENRRHVVSYEWRSDLDDVLSEREDFTLSASRLSTGSHVITFTVRDDEGDWSPPVTRTLTVQGRPSETRTLILVNYERMSSTHTLTLTETDRLVNSVTALAAHPSVQGQVIQLENILTVTNAYAAWDGDSTDTDKANAVAEAIKAVIDAQWTPGSHLEYLVIIGDDRIIPFRRVRDRTWYPESRYKKVSTSSTTGAALHDDMTLTDDFYADTVATYPRRRGWDGHALYIPDLGVGRLIETPAEIIAQINAFTLTNGTINAREAIVTGYDFVKDGAQAVCDTLRADGLNTDCSLMGGSGNWDAFISKVFHTPHDITSINGHADHWRMRTPLETISSADALAAEAIEAGVLFYTVGCHSGLNVPPEEVNWLDMAQALSQHQANYVANTGYGWGYVHSVGLSEKLMRIFSEHLTYGRSAAVGEALAGAKQEYYLKERRFDYYDEKIMIESTLYGLPMYRYFTPIPTADRSRSQTQEQSGIVFKKSKVMTLIDVLTVNKITYQFFTPTQKLSDTGLYYTFGDQIYVSHNEPIQPKHTDDISSPKMEPVSVVFRGGVYTTITPFNPVVEQAITETLILTEPTFSGSGWYPAQLQHLNRLAEGQRWGNNLVMALGQFNPQSETERIYSQLKLDVYYHTGAEDTTPPNIINMTSKLMTTTTAITVEASDASDIQGIVIAYTDGGGHWFSTDLDEFRGVWRGGFQAASETEFFIQALDKAGNVTVNDNQGR